MTMNWFTKLRYCFRKIKYKSLPLTTAIYWYIKDSILSFGPFAKEIDRFWGKKSMLCFWAAACARIENREMERSETSIDPLLWSELRGSGWNLQYGTSSLLYCLCVESVRRIKNREFRLGFQILWDFFTFFFPPKGKRNKKMKHGNGWSSG